ncbi:hypothetical protein Tco_0998782, partial [Tanacetum coccineum]
MERGFLSQKRSGGGRGVKEKNLNRALNNENVKDGVVPSATVDSAINNGDSTRKDLNFCTLITSAGKGADVAVSLESIRVINEWCIKTAYDFFLGKRMAYLIFSFMDGLDAMLENGPWFIRNNLNMNVLKEDVGNVSVWVKLHGVLLTAFSEDRLSGRSSYARVMIEIRADVELKDTIVVAMSKLVEEGFYTCTIRVEYEWNPPRLDVAKNLKKPSQAPRGIMVGPKVDFNKL